MPPRGRPVSKGRPPSSVPAGSHIVAIGNCRLDVPDALGYELSHDGFSAEFQDVGTLKVYEAITRIITPPVGLSFTLLNPKNVDDSGKLLLQDVLHLYNVELPAMSFAANTGKESPFLESCIMDGKYCTLILRKNDPGSAENELVGAVTFQILPPDTQQAEIPLAAVRHSHQRKGYGALMYSELKRRLVDVGVTSVFCWGDIESESFWSKQGYVKVAEVDGRGKPKKFPIKGDMKKAMSIPGSATLMISYLDCGIFPTAVSVPSGTEKGFIHSPSRPLKGANILETNNTSSPTNMVTTPQLVGEVKSSLATTPAETVRKSPQLSTVVFQKCNSSITPLNMEGKLFSVVPDVAYRTNSPGTATEPGEPGVNPLAILPFAGPDSEPLDFASGLPVADITNTLPTKRSPRPHEKRTYVRRRQTTTSSTSGNLVEFFLSPISTGKENIGEVNLVVNLERAASDEEGRLSAFLGPRTKAGHHKDGAPVDSEDSARQNLASNCEPKSSLSAFIGPRRKSGPQPECNLQIVPHGEPVQEHANKLDINVDQEIAKGVEILNKSCSTGLRPKRRGRAIKSNANDLQKGSPEDNVENDSVLSPSAPCGPKAGDKRGRPPKVHTSKSQKKGQEATGSDRVDLHGSGASEQRKDKTEATKRSRVSTSGREESSKQAPQVSSAPKVPSELGPKTAAQESDKAVENGNTDSQKKTVKKVSAKGHLSVSPTKGIGLKTGVKRGRPPKLVGTRTKRIKADTTNSKGLDSNQRCSETDEGVQNCEQEKGDEEGLAQIVGMLVPAHKDAAADSSAQESRDVNGTSGLDSLDTALRRLVQVTGSESADCGQVPLNESLTTIVARDSEPASTTGAKLHQELEKPKYVIMFMNMADENKKRQLSKHVEKLGGLVTCDGSICTHVVTMEVRRTLNFCVAISSGAWILSPDWLKASVKQKRFVGEESYILTDKKFEAKYNASLKDVIPKAQQMPNLLLDGLYICPTPNVHPPVTTISEIIKAAGGQVVATLEEALQLEKKSLGIVVACEGDMELAMAAAKAGLRTYNSDWLLTCIVKQELDFSVPQFTESL